MKRSKSSEPCDRLSELSDSVILHILSFMSMRDVVRTTILSKRWKDLWTMIPCLTFKGIAEPSHKFRSFVNGALIFWRGTRILKFELHSVFDPYFTRDLDSWLCFAKSKRVEELHIKLSGPLDGNNYSALQCLYSCSDIRNLSLVGCGLNPKVDGKIHWNNLKSLRIEKVPLSEHVINQVLSCSPGLEVLILCLRESCENLNIQSSSLKMLKILKERYYDEDKATKLRIWAPNLEQLGILGLRHCRSQLMNISSICRANVYIFAAETYGYQLFEEMLKQLSQSTHLVEKVTLYFPVLRKSVVTTKSHLSLSLMLRTPWSLKQIV